jgi:hypothetical protein
MPMNQPNLNFSPHLMAESDSTSNSALKYNVWIVVFLDFLMFGGFDVQHRRRGLLLRAGLTRQVTLSGHQLLDFWLVRPPNVSKVAHQSPLSKTVAFAELLLRS